MNPDDAVAMLDGRLDAALADRDLAAERHASEQVVLRENASLRATIFALEQQIASMRATFEAERSAIMSEANTDQLTGVLVRRGFERAADSEISRARGKPVSVLMIDVDHFKLVNDTGGHAFGDQVLSGLGGVLQKTFRREGDVVGRLGGEEFAVVMAAPLEVARARAEALRADLAAAGLFRPEGTLVTVSVGLATVESLQAKREELLEAADTALYRAKRSGRNRVVAIDDPEEPAATMVTDVDKESDVDDGFDADMLREVRAAGDAEEQHGLIGELVHGVAAVTGAPASPVVPAGAPAPASVARRMVRE